jgi:glucose/arabinose dehydrogenase
MPRRTTLPVGTLVPCLAAALTLAAPACAQEEIHKSARHDFRVVTVVEGLVNPWSMAFLPGGDILVTERPGRLRIARGGRLLPEPVPGLPAIRAAGQGGLLDLALHPDFARNRLVYFSYAKPSGDGSQGATAVARGRFENDRLSGVEDVFVAEVWSQGRAHYGSRLAFDGKGYLHITLGDRQVPPSGNLEAHPAQDLSNHFGTTIRLHDDGRVPADNPFVGRPGALPEIWTYGHRNGQGLVIDPSSGDVWQTEHGPQGGDELNLLQAGKNYGWPVVGHGVNYGSGLAIHKGTTQDGMEPPVQVWVPSIAPSGLMIYTGDKFPEWRGNLFSGALAGQQLVRLTMDGRQVMNVEQLYQRRGRVRDVEQGLDGYIYLAIEDSRGAPTPIVRLEPVSRR